MKENWQDFKDELSKLDGEDIFGRFILGAVILIIIFILFMSFTFHPIATAMILVGLASAFFLGAGIVWFIRRY